MRYLSKMPYSVPCDSGIYLGNLCLCALDWGTCSLQILTLRQSSRAVPRHMRRAQVRPATSPDLFYPTKLTWVYCCLIPHTPRPAPTCPVNIHCCILSGTEMVKLPTRGLSSLTCLWHPWPVGLWPSIGFPSLFCINMRNNKVHQDFNYLLLTSQPSVSGRSTQPFTAWLYYCFQYFCNCRPPARLNLLPSTTTQTNSSQCV